VQFELSSTYLLYLIGIGFVSLRLEVNDLLDNVHGENVVVYSMASGQAPRARRSENAGYAAYTPLSWSINAITTGNI